MSLKKLLRCNIVFLAIATLYGCNINNKSESSIQSEAKIETTTEAETPTEQPENRGVYCEKLMYAETDGLYPGGNIILYNGRAYELDTLTGSPADCSEVVNIEELTKTKLSDIYQDDLIWRVKNDRDIAQGNYGEIYEVPGYAPENVICVYEHTITPSEYKHDSLCVYKCLNDMWLSSGKELFDDILNISDAEKVVFVENENEISLSFDVREKFIELLNSSTPVELELHRMNADYSSKYNGVHYYYMWTDKNGLMNDVYITEDGYIGYRTVDYDIIFKCNDSPAEIIKIIK